jgi:hypothetical protein
MTMKIERFTVYEDAHIGPLLEPDEEAVCRASDVEKIEARIRELEAQNAALLADVNQDEGYERLKARCQKLEAALQLIGNELSLHADQGPAGEAFRALLVPTLETKGDAG